MTLKKLINKKIYFAPKNDISKHLVGYLEQNIEFANFGYLDNIKDKSDIKYRSEVDYIFISSPNYYKEIFCILSKYIDKKKILFCFENKYGNFSFYNNKNFYSYKKFYEIIFFKVKNVNYIKLLKYKNLHKSRRAFILGNGPSLKINDLNKLNDEITFAANKIYLAYENTSWRPTYYFVEDHLVYKQNFEEINKQKEISFFPTDTLQFGKIKNGIYYDFIFENYSPNLPKLSNNALSGLYWGGTVVYSMIQMALYMGIKEIYIIGLDFSFDVPKKSLNSKEDIVSEGEVNHFNKNYRKAGEKWTQPKLEVQELSFEKVDKFCKKNGIKIFNASRKTKLKIVEKIDFDTLF